MSWRLPRRPGRAEPTAGEDGERTGADNPGEALPTRAKPTDPGGTSDQEDRVRRAHGPVREQTAVTPPPVVVPRWVQLVVLPLAVLGLWALARAVGTVLLILLGASTIALILNPLVRLLHRHRIPRGLAILLVYLGGFAIIGGIGVALSEPVSNQVSHFEHNLPHYIDQANRDLASFQRWLDRRGIKVQIQRQGQTALQTLEAQIQKRSSAIVSFSSNLLSQVVTTSFDFVLTFVLSIYLLVYGEQIGDLVRRIMPAGDGTPEDDYPLLVQRAVYGYVRGQLLFSLIMGASAALSLWIFGQLGIFPAGATYAVFFGGFYGLMEFIPYIGPIIGPLPAVLVALFVHPISAVWVVLLFVALQQLEGHFVAPQVFRISLRINPILIILALLIGFTIYGVVGALLALPIATVIRVTVLYLRKHLVLEPWGPMGTGVMGAGTTGPTGQTGQNLGPTALKRCPDCGAAAGPNDAYCRSCGASLEPRVKLPG